MSFHVPKFTRNNNSNKDKSHADERAHERLGIRIVSVSMAGGLVSCYVKVSHGQHKAETSTIPSGGVTATVDYLCSLEVENAEETLLVELKSRRKSLFSSSSAVIGSAAIEIKKMHPVESCRHGATEPYDFNLVIHSNDSKEVMGEVKMQVIRCYPPKGGPSSFLSCLIGTWNVGNAPPGGDMSSWLKEQYLREVALVVIGSQECKYKERDGYKDCEDDFNGTIAAVLGKRHARFKVGRIGEIRLSIWARLDAVAGIHSVEWAEEAVGVGHVMANKGGIAAVLFVWDTSICFVNSHLAAHQDKCKRRNEDFSEIVSGMDVGFPNCGILNQFHHCVWMGDLNYRLDLSHMFDHETANARSPTPELFAKINELVDHRALDLLLKCDQLVQQREAGKAFGGFSEGLIRHVPTFKVERNLETVVYQDERAPAYCDRVLWRSLEGMEARSLDLWCADRVSSSDHKPVATVLQLSLRSARPEWWPRPVRDVNRGVQKHSIAQHPEETLVKCWRVQILELSGQELTPSDMNGKADPYVAFLGDALPLWAFTEVQYMTLNPEWRPSSLPTFTIAATSKEALKEEYLIVQAMDHDRFDPDDSLGTGILPLCNLVHTSDEQLFEVQLLHGGVHAGVIRGRLRIREASAMSVSTLRKQHLAKQRFEPSNLCCCNLCVYRNPFASSDSAPPPPSAPPSQPGTQTKLSVPADPAASHAAAAAMRPAPLEPLEPARAVHHEASGERDLAIQAAPQMRRFLAPTEPSGGAGLPQFTMASPAGALTRPPSAQHSSLSPAAEAPRRHRVPDPSFDPVASAPPVYPTRLGPGQFIPARHAPAFSQGANSEAAAAQDSGWRPPAARGGGTPPSHVAGASQQVSHFRAPDVEPRYLDAASGRPHLPHSFKGSEPVYLPPWERAGFEPPAVLSTGTYYKSQMYDSHYPPPRFRHV